VLTHLLARPGRIAVAALLAALASLAFSTSAPNAQTRAAANVCEITTTERIVAVGDVHGAFDNFVTILQEAGVLGRNRRWSGGRTVFLQLGDVTDRGPDSKQVFDLLRRMETDAARAGGQVHVLVGNHEVMRLEGDMRYVSAKEYAAFESADAREFRDGLYDILAGQQRDHARAAGEEFDERTFRETFYKQTPLGLIEMHRAYSTNGEYGRWLRARPAVVRVNGIVFVHGGISPAVAALGCTAVDARTRAELQKLTLGGAPPPAAPAEGTVVEPTLISRIDGPLWYRGLLDGTATAEDAAAVFATFGARAIVMGHTAMEDGRVQSRFDGRAIAIDTGMLNGTFYPNGVPAAIEIKGDVVTAIYKGRREVLPDKIGAPIAR